jgi:WD40 repeat protein
LLAVATLLLITSGGLYAADEKSARTDRHGDPLPAGAIARLGSVRFQHGGRVFGLVYSPDGKHIASTGEDAVVRLWDVETGTQSLTLKGHERGVTRAAFVPAGDGKPASVLVSTGYDKTIRFWDLKTGKELGHIVNHPGAAMALEVSPDGKLVASAGETHVFLWKVEDGKEVRRWKAHHGGVMCLAFAPDGKSIASGGLAQRPGVGQNAKEPGDDYGIALWDTDTGKVRRTLAAHTEVGWGLAFAADGKTLASYGYDKTAGRSLLLWDAQAGKQLRALGDRAGVHDARYLVFSKDGKTLAAGDLGLVKFFDTDTGAEARAIAPMDRAQALAFAPDGKTVATVGDRGRILFWDVAQRKLRHEVEGHAQPLNSVAVSPDGKIIATSCDDGSAMLWERATSKPLRRLKDPKIGIPVAWCAAFSPDGRTIALSHQRNGISFWDVETGQLQHNIPPKDFDRVVSVAYSPDGKWLASESTDQTYTSLWDVSTGKLQRQFEHGTKRYQDGGTSVAISPDGRFLAATATNGLNVWHLQSGRRLLLKPNAGRSVAFSPGGFLVAAAGAEAVVFDALTGTGLARFEAQYPGWRSIAFSPDGRLLAAANLKRIKLWEVATRRELPGFEGHRGPITSVAFTPDGKALVSASEDSTALIWDLGALPPPREDEGKFEWNDLHQADRLRAYAAFCRLRAAPNEALALLKANLQPVAPARAERLADLIKKLDDDNVKVRDQATQELKDLGLGAEKALREAARNKRSLEAAKRLEQLLAELDAGASWQRTLIGLKLLEELPPAKVREFLEILARGDADALLTREATAMLQRAREREQKAKP